MALDSDLTIPSAFVFEAPPVPLGFRMLTALGSTTAEHRAAVLKEMMALPQLDLPLNHSFSKNVYARQISMPADSLVIGKLHATEHLNMVLSGTVSVWSEQGGLQHITGPCTFNSVAGTRKYLYCHTDVLWTTIHVTDETDLVALEAALIIDESCVVEN